MKEIERRFLVEDISKLDLNNYEKRTIEQHYLYRDKFTVIRKRKVSENGVNKYYYTIKNKVSKYVAEENEKEITLEEYESIPINKSANVIEKERYVILIENNLKIELDVFKGVFEGIIFAEIEFETEEQAKNFNIPDWFGKELTGKISNSKMSKLKLEELKEILDKNIK